MKPDTAIYTAYDDHTPQDAADAEKNLMRAILTSAMQDIKKRGEAYRDARRYLSSGDDSYLYSFESICRHLDLCSATLRELCGVLSEKK